jgi:glycerophosphoryl diester phosphodiesterase
MKKKLLIVLLGLVLIYLIIFLLPRPQSVLGDNVLRKQDGEKPYLIAHGGGNHEFPDNTLEAFYHAYSVDPHVIMETDVNLTSDGVILLSHDTTLDRKTVLINAPIYETSYQSLIDNEIDFAYHNDVVPNSNGFNESGILKPYLTYLGESVTPLDVTYPEGVSARHDSKFLATTLRELIISFPHNKINVEVKQPGEIGLLALAKIIELFDELDGDYQTYERIVLVSFHREIFLEMLRLKSSSHPLLMVAPEQQGVIKFFALYALGLDVFYNDPIHVLQLPTSSFGINLSTKNFIRRAHRHNIAVHYWTIDDEDEMIRLFHAGADGIMTNRPSLFKEVMDSLS